MNQISKFDYDISYCEKKQAKPTRTELKCGSLSFVAFPLFIVADTTVTLAPLSIDVSEFERPHILLSFTANVHANAFDNYSFQIFRQCLDQPTPIPVSEIYYHSKLDPILDSASINFTVCDNDFCKNRICNYFVVITGFTVAVFASYISNATLSAIISDNSYDY
ncbi:MAG: DUF4489 domain-containing protein [Prevotella sp.]|jgi:hypothetical protein|nr:DUF4489 domain-containing protein [Prevotella sp.]